MISLSWCRTLQLVLLVTSPQLPAENPPSEQNDHYGYEVELRPVQLPERLVTGWLDELLPLLDDEEARDIRSTFTRLPSSSARVRFLEGFWRDRDPEPRTILNETRRQFERHRAVALATGWSLSDPRSNLILRHGPFEYRYDFGDCFSEETPDVLVFQPSPDHRRRQCTVPQMDLMAWGPSGERPPFAALFFRKHEECRRLEPGENLMGASSNHMVFQRLERQGCFLVLPELRHYLELAIEEQREPRAIDGLGLRLPPRKMSEEALAERLPATPAHSSFTAMRSLVAFTNRVEPLPALAPGPVADGSTVQVEGLLELEGPDLAGTSALPLVALHLSIIVIPKDDAQPRIFFDNEVTFFPPFERWQLPWSQALRPGSYSMIVQVRRLGGDDNQLLALEAFELEVPSEFVMPPAQASRPSLWSRILDTPRIELPSALQGMHLGVTDVTVVTSGRGVEAVSYRIDGVEVAHSDVSPFGVQIDFGEVPMPHRLEAIALDSQGGELARDSFDVNAGAHRFEVRLTDVRQTSPHVLTGRARVLTPRGSQLDRVELRLDDQPLGALHDPPFRFYRSLPTEASSLGRPRLLQATAYLVDGGAPRMSLSSELIGRAADSTIGWKSISSRCSHT